jgi:predicted PurR-regulated permease PerM
MRVEKHVWFWLSAFVALLALLAVLRDVMVPFAAGAIIAYLLNPGADLLERWGLNRSAASALMVLLIGLVIGLALVFLLPLAVGQIRQLADTLPADLARLQGSTEIWIEQHFGGRFPGLKSGMDKMLSELAQGSAGFVGAAASTLWSRGLALFNLVSLLLVTPVVAFYLLRDWHTMLARIDTWLPRDHADTIRRLAGDINGAVSAFVRGQSIICLLLAVMYAAALSALGLRYGLVIGIATGFLGFVPIVGWGLGLAVAMVVALGQGWPDQGLALGVAGIYGAGLALDSAVLSPNIVGQRIGLHPVWLIFALFVLSALFGFLGVLVAVPMAAALGVLIRFARDRYLESTVFLGEHAEPSGRNPTP